MVDDTRKPSDEARRTCASSPSGGKPGFVFRSRNGMECVMNEHGIAEVPGAKGIPNFNLEDELAAAGQFHLDAVSSDPKRPAPSRMLTRAELAALTDGSAAVEVHDHEDE